MLYVYIGILNVIEFASYVYLYFVKLLFMISILPILKICSNNNKVSTSLL